MSDPQFLLAVARMFERLIVEVIGGLTVYFGYRLFTTLPVDTNQSGKITLPGVSVTLSRVGPGIFFVAFGTVVLYASFKSPIEIEPNGKFVGAVARGEVGPSEVARAAGAIQTLNCLAKTSRTVHDNVRRQEWEIAARDAKIALLYQVWNERAWGQFGTFQRWAESGTGTVFPALKQIYLDEGPCR